MEGETTKTGTGSRPANDCLLGLEPYEGKLSRTVLRRERRSNPPDPAANNLNSILIEGNLVRGDPEYRETAKGTALCKFAIASNRFFR